MSMQLYYKLSKKNLTSFYILSEFIGYFFFSLSLFLSINISTFVLFGLIDLMVKYGISFYLFFELFVYSIPEMIFYAIPMSVLLASILSIGRLFRDNELLSFELTGKSKFHLFKPILYFVIVITIVSIFFNNFLVSKSNQALSKKIMFAQYQNHLPFNKKEILYKEFDHEKLKRTFYSKEFDGKIMKKPVVQEFESTGEMSSILTAEKAELVNGIWLFYKGNIYNIEEKKYNSIVEFEKYSIPFFKALESVVKETREPKEMSFMELKAHINKIKLSGTKTGFMETQLYQKITIPLMSIFFFLLSVPIATSNKNKNTSFAFTMSIVLIFTYYLIMFAFTAIGSLEIISPIFCAFAPNLIFLILILIYVFSKRNSFNIF